MALHHDWEMVEMEGHDDNRGKEEDNYGRWKILKGTRKVLKYVKTNKLCNRRNCLKKCNSSKVGSVVSESQSCLGSTSC